MSNTGHPIETQKARLTMSEACNQMMTKEEKLEFQRKHYEAEQKLLANGGERCPHCHVVWEDQLAVLCCPCLEMY